MRRPLLDAVERADFSPRAFVDAVREGADKLDSSFGLKGAQWTSIEGGNGVNGGGCYGSVLLDNPGGSPLSPGSANATTIATELPPLQNIDENWEKALAVVAHPDDLEYSAAAAIVRWTSQGKTITYCMATCGEAGIDDMMPRRCRPTARTRTARGRQGGRRV